MGQRWALYIDIEGFGAKWNDDTMSAFRGINALMQGIYWIGDRHYRDPPNRLFAYQFGDGFLIASEFHEASLDRAILVGVALLRHLLANGETAKCSVAEGGLSDVQGCYPKEIRSQLTRQNIQLGRGVMTVTPVMGSALVRAASMQKKAPPGPLMVVSIKNRDRVGTDLSLTKATGEVAAVNWLLGDFPGLIELQTATGFAHHTEAERESQLRNYIGANKCLSGDWKTNARKYLLHNGI